MDRHTLQCLHLTLFVVFPWIPCTVITGPSLENPILVHLGINHQYAVKMIHKVVWN